MFVTMKSMDFFDIGIQIDCNQTVYAAKTVCAHMRRHNTLTVLNDERTLLRYNWFDKVISKGIFFHIGVYFKNIFQINETVPAIYTIMRGSKNIRDVGRVVAVNNEPILNIYMDEKCNAINGTDSMYFPPFQRKDDVLWTYSPSACKSFPIFYKYKKTVRGVRTAYKALRFSDPMVSLQLT